MSTIVIMPGGFHPFHAGHAALYQSAVEAFPGAEVFVAPTNDTSNRPFPFAIIENLAKLAGVAPGHFVQVKSPFRAEEITSQFDPDRDRLIFVRSEKDAAKPPQAGGIKKDGSAAYLQPLAGQTNIRPFKEHAYMAYLPTVEFGPGMTSATEIRAAWPNLNEKRKTALVMSLYPATQKNPKLAVNVVKMLDTAMGAVDESVLGNLPRPNKRNQFKSLHRLRKQRGLDEQGVAEATGDERFDSMMGKITGGTGSRQGVDNLNKSLAARTGSDPETALAKWGQEFIKWLEDICRNFSRQGVDRFNKLKKLSEFEDGGETMAYWLIEVAKQTKTSGITLADIQEFSSEFNTHGMWAWQMFPIAWSQNEWQDYKDQWSGPDGYIANLGQGVAEASDRMQRYGQKILKRAQAARDAEPEPKKQQPPALNSISTRELMQQLKKPKNKNVAAAPDYMEENIKRE